MQNWDFGRLISFSITDNESIGIIQTFEKPEITNEKLAQFVDRS